MKENKWLPGLNVLPGCLLCRWPVFVGWALDVDIYFLLK